MMISKVLVAVLAVSAIAMACLQNVEGERDMVTKEAKAHNPKIFNQILGYKPREAYDSDGYKDGDCNEYGKCEKPKEEYGCDGYRYKGTDCDEYGNCDNSPYREDDSKQMTESKKEAGKYGVHHNYP